jgi:hypothetical protein
MKSRAVCILGMHRSGTSVVARCINLLGAYLGEDVDFIPPLSDNPKGYWERNDVVDFDMRLLDKMKTTWNTSVPLPKNWHRSDEIKPFRDELFGFIKDTFSDHSLWAWKDPRISLLLPIWRDVLNEMDIQLSVVSVIRNPLDVASSLKKRDGFSYDKSFGIWFNYNISILKTMFDLPYVLIHFDRLINDWEFELRKCAIGLGIAWPSDDSQLREKMNAFIRPGLRHSFSDMNALKGGNAPAPVVKLYTLLMEAMELSRPAKEISAEIERLSFDFESYARFFQFDMYQLWERWQKIVEKDKQLFIKEQQIQAMLTSYSWKITIPLRWFIALYRKCHKTELKAINKE